jgi:hypothetical protein
MMCECRWCGAWHGPRCPWVRAIEYSGDGTITRVEFFQSAVSPFARNANDLVGAALPNGAGPEMVGR